MRDSIKYLIKKAQFKGPTSVSNFLDRRGTPIIPYNWKRYKYFVFDAVTPEYGIMPYKLKIKSLNSKFIINVVYDTVTDEPICIWQHGFIIWVNEVIDNLLAERIHGFFEPPVVAIPGHTYAGCGSSCIVSLEADRLFCFKESLSIILDYSVKVFNVLPLDIREKVNEELAFTRLRRIGASTPYDDIGMGLSPLAANLIYMYEDIVT